MTIAAKMRALRAAGSLVTRLADPDADTDLIIADLQAVTRALGIQPLEAATVEPYPEIEPWGIAGNWEDLKDQA